MKEQAFPERFAPPETTRRRRRWPFRFAEHPVFHLGLLLTTFVTTTVAGGLFAVRGGLLGRGTFSDGLPFSIPLLLILGTHELGHYLVCRRYRLAATLPYFIPSPFLGGFGTFGAVIRIKEPIRDKRVLIEVGAAGPLVGFLMTLPFLFYGVSHARPISGPTVPGTVSFDYPPLVSLAQHLTGVVPYTSATVHEHPTFMAAWLGLLVTALNLLPIGQLDGGHVLRAVVGRSQPRISFLVLVAAVASAYWGPNWVVFSLFVALVIGIRHPPVENEEQPLGFARGLLALACLIVFCLCFSLVPFRVT